MHVCFRRREIKPVRCPRRDSISAYAFHADKSIGMSIIWITEIVDGAASYESGWRLGVTLRGNHYSSKGADSHDPEWNQKGNFWCRRIEIITGKRGRFTIVLMVVSHGTHRRIYTVQIHQVNSVFFCRQGSSCCCQLHHDLGACFIMLWRSHTQLARSGGSVRL